MSEIKFKYEGQVKIGKCKNGDTNSFSPFHQKGKDVLIPNLLIPYLTEGEVYFLSGEFKDYETFFVFVPENMGFIKKILKVATNQQKENKFSFTNFLKQPFLNSKK